MAGYSVFRHAGTEVDYCFIVEDTICRLIINGRVGQSIPASAAHRTVRESLPSYGSCYSVNI